MKGRMSDEKVRTAVSGGCRGRNAADRLRCKPEKYILSVRKPVSYTHLDVYKRQV